jgi:hypothetical protein
MNLRSSHLEARDHTFRKRAKIYKDAKYIPRHTQLIKRPDEADARYGFQNCFVQSRSFILVLHTRSFTIYTHAL